MSPDLNKAIQQLETWVGSIGARHDHLGVAISRTKARTARARLSAKYSDEVVEAVADLLQVNEAILAIAAADIAQTITLVARLITAAAAQP